MQVKMRMGAKITLTTVLLITLFVAISFGYLIQTSKQKDIAKAKELANILARDNAAAVEKNFDYTYNKIGALADIFHEYESIDRYDRREYFNMQMKGIVERNAGILGVWTVWEPDALDNLDYKNKNSDDSNSTGRFVPYWVRFEGKVILDICKDFETPGAGDYYIIPKKSGDIIITEPYEFEVNGTTVKACTISFPIKDKDNKILGVVGAEISIDEINRFKFNVGHYKKPEFFMLTNNGDFILHNDTSIIGKNLSVCELTDDKYKMTMDAIKGGKSLDFESFSISTGSQSLISFTPVKIGDTKTPWAVGLVLPMNEILETTKSSTISTIIIALIAIVLIAASIAFSVNRIASKPIKEIVEQANKLSIGDTEFEIDTSKIGNDEIGELKLAFKKLADNIVALSSNADELANGNIDLEVTPRSDKDKLALSMKKVIFSVRELVNEADKLTNEAVAGNLAARGNTENLEGGFKLVLEGVNETLDAISKPMEKSLYALNEIAQGNLDVRIEEEYEGDFALIKQSVNTTAIEIQSYIAELTEVLGKMSNSDLDVEITREYLGDFNEIKQSVNEIISSFNIIVSEIKQAADQVGSGAREVSDSSQTLSQGATEQASSVEEMSATITEVAEQTKLNAVNANNANEIAVTTKAMAEEGNAQMSEMVDAMREISEASKNISSIIKVIDDIAFQTNILALNAAVEAARANEHGKGFAVVAEEVRSLAARSAEAAKETTDLIENSIKKVSDGTDLANETASALKEIVISINDVSSIIDDIASSSSEQASAINQINDGIIQVSDVTQSNTATAEESASASEEMSTQASYLQQLVGKFKLRSDNAEIKPQNKATKKAEKIEIKEDKQELQISLDDNEFGKY